MTPRYARVVLPLPLAEGYTYLLPDALPDPEVGQRVVVPVRSRRAIGVVEALDVPAPEVAARPVERVLDDAPAVTPPLLALARWLARHYGAPLGLAVRALLPGPFWSAGTRAAPATERILALAGEPPTLLERDAVFGRRRRQRELYETVESLGGAAPVRHLTGQLGFDDALVRALVASGLAAIQDSTVVRDPFSALPATPPPTSLTDAQRQALERIESLPPGGGAVLFGVTGSGKTLVYMEAVRAALAAGQGAIVLVPEIALTPQTVSRFRGAFGDAVAVLHSGLSDGERADAWRLLRSGERRVAIGARSAIFAPLPSLGLIVVDEEHEASYKNGEAPRYHARDVAMVRARLEGARLVLGSATPSLETMERVRAGRDPLALLELPVRIGERPLPPVELVDLRHAPLVAGTAPVPWSERLDRAMDGALARGEQVLLLLNRRGFANFLQCPECGTVTGCPNCSVALTVHRAPAGLRCHHCGHDAPLPDACPACGGAVQQMRGVGTQQVERLVAERFPAARVARMDLDTTSTKWSHHRILDALDRGELDVLVGTQMIAKGLDFPRVTLVGVVDADVGLYVPDFRAAERTYQLVAQVAGRAGRGPAGGTVLVQTRAPQHPALVHAARHDTRAFLAAERESRRVPPYPPEVSLANLLLYGRDEAEAARHALRLADWCHRLMERHALPLTVLGPAPCPLSRIKDRWRWHVLVRGAAQPLGRFVRAAGRMAARAPSGVTVVVDRDPVSVL